MPATQTAPFDRAALAAEYHALCADRDARYEAAAAAEAKLAAVNAERERLRLEAEKLAAEVDAAHGPDFLAVKKKIADIARFFGRVPPKPEKG